MESKDTLNLSREKLISVLFHELKGPLGAIAGYLSLLRKGVLGTDLPAYAEVLERSEARLDQMQELLSDLQDVSILDSGNRERKMTILSAQQSAEAAFKRVEAGANARHISIDTSIPADLTLEADPWEIGLVLHHLLSNAVRYNSDNGQAKLALRQIDPCTLEIQVSDTGIGIAPEHTDSLCRDFIRLKTPQTHGIFGTGLGLSIVRRIAALNGGGVHIESELGKGSIFSVRMHVGAKS